MQAPRQTHVLYVKVDRKNRQVTLNILKFIAANLPSINAMGITVRIKKIYPQMLANPSVVQALSARKINKLPALIAFGRVYVGAEIIVSLYSENIKKLIKPKRSAAAGLSDCGDLEEFYQNEIERAHEEKRDGGNGDDEAMGNEDRGMMDAVRNHQRTREQKRPSSKRLTPETGTGGGRPDNVATSSHELRMATANTGGPVMDDEDAKDDIMMSAWANSKYEDEDGEFDVKNMLQIN